MNNIYENNRFTNIFIKNRKYWIFVFIIIASIVVYSFTKIFIDNKNNELAAELYSKWELELSNKNADDLNISDSLFNELISDYSTTGYAKIALLKQASININNKNFDNALNQYLTLIDLTDGFKGNKLFNKIARINSARLYYNQEQYTEALLLLEKYSTSSTDAIIHELIGDILKKQEKYDLAKDQYLRAKEKYNENLSLSIINMKLTSVE
jgi:predicted negative regulator of RcsB-dependent stress response